MTAVGGNYISDGQIMAWLTSQQDRIYGDLRDSMDLADRRADFQSALTNVQTKLAEANGNKDFKEVDAMLQDLLAEYGSEPQFAEACGQLRGMADRIHADYERAAAFTSVAATSGPPPQAQQMGGGRGGNQPIEHNATPSTPPAVRSYSKEQLKEWETLLGGQIDNMGRNDQLTMVKIQELKATLDQGSQLASTFISSGDKTSSAIINNIA